MMDQWLRSVATHQSLFIVLVVAGVALIVGVLVYNMLQERRVRRVIEKGSRGPPVAARERAEPTLRGDDSQAAVPRSVAIEEEPETQVEPVPEPLPEEVIPAAPAPLGAARPVHDAIAPDADIECVVVLTPGSPVPSAALARARAAPLGKPARWLGRRGQGLPWQAINGAPGPWQQVAACLLLADRSGAASRTEILNFVGIVAGVASDLPAGFTPPDADSEAERAEELDRLCADLDVQIGLTILKAELGQIAGTRLRGVAEAAGFRLTAGGNFEYLQEETGAVLCTLQNYKQEPFTVESLRVLSTPGVVLIIDVPRVADPVRVFDQMRLTAKRLAQTLEGVLVDDNRRPLDDASLAAIRTQVQATAAALREANIDPGSPRALRLFG
jgi:FtsZ-interacting cell division protein ZipA